MQKGILDGGGFEDFLGLRAVDDEQRTAAILIFQLDVDHPLCVLVGVGIEEHTVNHAEDSGCCPDAEHEGKDGTGGETRRFEELPKREA